MKRILILLLLLPTLALAATPLRDLEGRPADLHAWVGQGRWTVVMIWSWDCPICNREVEAWDLFDDAHRDRDARVIGLSINGGGEEAKARAFVEEHDLGFPSLIGTARQVDALLRRETGQGLRGTPTFLLYDPRGRIVGMQVGPLPTEAVEEILRRHDGRHETGSSGAKKPASAGGMG